MQPFKGQSKETLNGCFRSTKKFQKANKMVPINEQNIYDTRPVETIQTM